MLTDSWTLQEEDKDMIVMYHNLEETAKKEQIDAKMVCLGDQTYTAMAKTVGYLLPWPLLLS
jgi:hypothetical protein